MFLWIIICVMTLFVLNNIFLAIYCRIEEKFDAREERKRQKIRAELIENIEKTVRNEEHTAIKKSGLKHSVGKLHSELNHYLYGWMRYCIIQTGKIPSGRCRNYLYRFIFYMKITKRTVIYGGCEIRSPWNIKADNCVISTYCILDGRRGIIIGDNVVFGGGVHVWTEEHDVNDSYFAVNFQNAQPVVIEDRAWICSDSTILPGIHIGEGAVVATRAVVTKDCEPFSVYGGVPARKISMRNKDLKYELNGKPTWHFY